MYLKNLQIIIHAATPGKAQYDTYNRNKVNQWLNLENSQVSKFLMIIIISKLEMNTQNLKTGPLYY